MSMLLSVCVPLVMAVFVLLNCSLLLLLTIICTYIDITDCVRQQ